VLFAEPRLAPAGSLAAADPTVIDLTLRAHRAMDPADVVVLLLPPLLAWLQNKRVEEIRVGRDKFPADAASAPFIAEKVVAALR
jgi:hypothetical protein